MEGENGDSEDPRSFGSKAVWKRMIVVTAGAAMNILIGIVLMYRCGGSAACIHLYNHC